MSIIITGADGSLGSAIARQLSAQFPSRYHLVLTARNPAQPSDSCLSTALVQHGARFSWEALDLASFSSVREFVKRVEGREYAGLIHAETVAELNSSTTQDGFDEMYQVNVLSPILLTQSLKPSMKPGGKILMISSSTHRSGDLDFFKASSHAARGTSCHFTDALRRFGSTKLLLVTAAQALQAEAGGDIQIACVDPGGVGGESRLYEEFPFILRAARSVMGTMAPLIQCMDKAANTSSVVPAKAISQLFRGDRHIPGAYFALDEMKKSDPEWRDPEISKSVLQDLRADIGA